MTLESFISSSDEQISQQHVPRMGGALEHVLYSDPEIFRNVCHVILQYCLRFALLQAAMHGLYSFLVQTICGAKVHGLVVFLTY